jgi:CshA-type fibril repeat protein
MKRFNRLLRGIFLLIVGANILLYATGTDIKIITDDKISPAIENRLGATKIVELSAHYVNSTKRVNNYIIKSLPDANLGVLYMPDGVTAVAVGQNLIQKDACCLLFDPIKSSEDANATFTYVGITPEGVEGTFATVIIPLIVGTCGQTVLSYNKENATAILNTLGATDIVDLSGKKLNGEEATEFRIISLPSSDMGVLYLEDGITEIAVGDILTLTQANGIKFDPNVNFVGDAIFTYMALDGNVEGNEATVTIPVIAPSSVSTEPTADDKYNPQMLNSLDAVNILDLSGTDSDGEPVEHFMITSLPSVNQGILYMDDGITTVVLNQLLTQDEAEGLKFDPNASFIGEVKFTYVAIDDNDIKSSDATVTIPLIASHNTDIITHNDRGYASGNADVITVNVLENDAGSLEGVKVYLIDADGNMVDELAVLNEGVWRIDESNNITFTPVAPFVGTPTSVSYVVQDVNGAVSNPANISIFGQCVCEPYREDIPVFSRFGLLLMLLFSTLLGYIFINKEY